MLKNLEIVINIIKNNLRIHRATILKCSVLCTSRTSIFLPCVAVILNPYILLPPSTCTSCCLISVEQVAPIISSPLGPVIKQKPEDNGKIMQLYRMHVSLQTRGYVFFKFQFYSRLLVKHITVLTMFSSILITFSDDALKNHRYFSTAFRTNK